MLTDGCRECFPPCRRGLKNYLHLLEMKHSRLERTDLVTGLHRAERQEQGNLPGLGAVLNSEGPPKVEFPGSGYWEDVNFVD
jgi:hypothetical protein